MIIDINLYGEIIMSNKPIKKRINFYLILSIIYNFFI